MILAIIDGIFVISAGVITALLWFIVIFKKLGHKFVEKKSERTFHIVAELLMSVIAIMAGIALLLNKAWGIHLFYLAMGLIFYASVNAIGIYREKKYRLLVFTLIATAVLTLTLVIISLVLLTI